MKETWKKKLARARRRISKRYASRTGVARTTSPIIIDPRKDGNRLGFDPALYLALNPDLNDLAPELAFKHLMDEGWKDLRPFTMGYAFCPLFYKSMNADLADFSDEEAYRHWLEYGHQEGRTPSAEVFMNSIGFNLPDLPASFSHEIYTFNEPALRALNPYQAFRHYIEVGFGEGRILASEGDDTTDLLRLLSDYFAGRGQVELAVRCLDRLLSREPTDGLALQAYGDIHLSAGHNYSARAFYHSAAAAGLNSYWNHVNSAISAERLGMHGEAIDAFQAARILAPGSEMLRSSIRRAGASRFDIALTFAARRGAKGDKSAAQKIVREAVQDYIEVENNVALPGPVDSRRLRKPRIGMLAAHLVPVCWEYRVKQRKLQFEAAGYEFEAWPLSEVDDFTSHLHLFDIAIFFRLPAQPEVLKAILYAERLGVVTVGEIDDLIFDEATYPPPYETFAGMVSRDWYAGLISGATQHKELLKLCDFGIGSTPALVDAVAPLVKRQRAFLHRNALNHHRDEIERDTDALERRPQTHVTIFYGSGSKSHNANFAQLAAPAITKILDLHQNTRLMVTGPLDLNVLPTRLSSRIEHLDYVSDDEAYKRLLSQADINIAPLTQSSFNDCKSEIKWLEAAVLGIPSVVSSSDMYRRTVEHGVDAMIADNVDDWFHMLNRLVLDEALRLKVGRAAREHALSRYDLKSMALGLDEIVKQMGPDESGTLCGASHRPQRILLVNTHYAPQSIGGAARSVEGIARELSTGYPDDFVVEVFCAQQYGAPGNVERYSFNQVSVTALAPWDRPDLGLGDEDHRVAEVFANLVDEFEPDMIHFHAMQLLSASPLDVAREKGIPYVVTAHDGWWISDQPFLADQNGDLVMQTGRWGETGRLERLKRRLLEADRVLTPSATFEALYQSRGITNATSATNGVHHLPPTPLPPYRGRLTLGLLGGLGVAKGASLLKQALGLKTFPNLEFVVVDHEAAADSSRVERWGKADVTLVGRIPQDQIGELYGRLHGVLAISVCAESFGLVAREASSLGRWVIASDRGAVSEDIRPGENGFIVDVSNPMPLIDVLSELDSRSEFYAAGTLVHADLKTISQQVDELVDIYRNIILESQQKTRQDGNEL